MSEDPAQQAPNIAADVSPRAARLAAELHALSAGLPNPWDESTDYFAGFAVALPAAVAVDAEALRAAFGIAAHCEISLAPAAPLLASLGDAQASWGDKISAGFRRLGQVMVAELGELWLAHARGAGEVRVPLWLFGRGDGALIGLSSISTET